MAASLSDSVRTGVAWTTGLSFLSDVLQFGVTVVLARLLEPAAYGQFALVTAVITWLSVLSFRSFVEFVVHEPAGRDVDYDSYFAAGGILQGALMVVVLLLAAGLARSSSYGAAAPLLAAMALYFPLDWLSELRVKMLERALDWGRLNRLRVAGLVLNAVSALVLALSGAGAYALLLPGLIALTPMAFDLVAVARWRPRWRVDWEALRPARRFGMARMGSGLAFTSRQLVESAAMSGARGFTAAGFYGRSTGLANLACLRLPSVLTLMLRPVLTRVDAATRYHHAAGLVLRSVIWIVAPAAALCVSMGEPLIRVVYGSRWLPALDLLPWAVGAASAAALVQTGNILLLGLSRSRQCLAADSTVLAGCVAATTLLLAGRLELYLGAVTLVNAGAFAMQLRWLAAAGALRWGHLIDTVGPCMVSVTGALLLAQPLQAMPPAYGLAFGFCYVLLLRLLSAPLLRELVSYCPGRTYLERVL